MIGNTTIAWTTLGKYTNDEKNQIWQLWKGGGQIQKPCRKSNSSPSKKSPNLFSIQNGRHVQVHYVGLLKHEELFLDFQAYLDFNRQIVIQTSPEICGSLLRF